MTSVALPHRSPFVKPLIVTTTAKTASNKSRALRFAFDGEGANRERPGPKNHPPIFAGLRYADAKSAKEWRTEVTFK